MLCAAEEAACTSLRPPECDALHGAAEDDRVGVVAWTTYGVMLSCRPNLCLLSPRLTVSTCAASVIVVSDEIFCLYDVQRMPSESTFALTVVSLSSLYAQPNSIFRSGFANGLPSE